MFLIGSVDPVKHVPALVPHLHYYYNAAETVYRRAHVVLSHNYSLLSTMNKYTCAVKMSLVGNIVTDSHNCKLHTPINVCS